MNAQRSILAIAFWLSLCLLSHPADAQDAVPAAAADDIEETPAAPQFDVELIIFEYVDGVVGGREDWRYIDTGRADVQRELEEARAAALSDVMLEPETPATEEDRLEPTESLPEEPVEDPFPLEFWPTAERDLLLPDLLLKLRNSREYRPILHTGWRQTVYGQENEKPLALERVATLPEQLGGEASLYVSRFLHLKLDLELAKRGAIEAGDAPSSVVYRLDERRKMRSGELHFFDHPRFGALVLISRTD